MVSLLLKRIRTLIIASQARDFSFQAHFAVTPFAEIALALQAVGLNENLDAGREHFVGDAETFLLATRDRFQDHSSHLVPLRNDDGEKYLVDLRFRYRRWKLDLVPPERTVDLGKRLERYQVAKSVMTKSFINRLQQLGIQLDNKLFQRGGIFIPVLKDGRCCFRLVEFAGCLQQIFKNFGGLVSIHAFDLRKSVTTYFV